MQDRMAKWLLLVVLLGSQTVADGLRRPDDGPPSLGRQPVSTSAPVTSDGPFLTRRLPPRATNIPTSSFGPAACDQCGEPHCQGCSDCFAEAAQQGDVRVKDYRLYNDDLQGDVVKLSLEVGQPAALLSAEAAES